MSDSNTVNTYELVEIQKHVMADDCWVVHGKDVFDVTAFLDKHPGGGDLILENAGNNIREIIRDVNIHAHTPNAYSILREYKIGELLSNSITSNDSSDVIEGNNLIGFKEEDLIDWDRGMVFQVYKLGDDYSKWVHTPVNREMRLFESDIAEFFTKTPWYMIPLIWSPIVILSWLHGYRNIRSESTLQSDSTESSFYFIPIVPLTGFYFLFGMFAWTLVEYLIHRYLFHFEPNGDSPLQITIHFICHGIHHKLPFDEKRLVFPPLFASLFVSGLWFIFTSHFPEGVGAIMFSGNITGYICYDMIHYYIHHGNPVKGGYLDGIKRNHVEHHFVDSNRGFGISSKFWDMIFDVEQRKLL